MEEGNKQEIIESGLNRLESQSGKPHWTQRPWSMLAAVLILSFFLHLADLGITLPFSQANLAVVQGRVPLLATLSTALSVALTLAVNCLFFCYVRRVQRKSESTLEISWKIGAAFWAGVALALANIPLQGFTYLAAYPLAAAMNFLSSLIGWFGSALIFSLLYPAMEKRFGSLKGALVIAGSYALLSVPETMINAAMNWLIFQQLGLQASFVWQGLAKDIVSIFVTTVSLYLLRSALYLCASRRIPGTWMMFASVPGLVSLLYRLIESSFHKGFMLTGWLLTLCIQFPYYLLVFALSLGVVAGFQKFKAAGAFACALHELLRKARLTQNDIPD